MTYDCRQKTDQFDVGKTFEIINSGDPMNAFFQEPNSLAGQKAVITHVETCSDLFRNN